MTPTPRPSLLEKLKRFHHWHELVLALLIVVVLIAAHGLDPAFLAGDAQAELSTHVWELALLALPMTLIIITAGIDLSVGATMALSAVVLGQAYSHHLPIGIAVLLAVVTGVAAGALNGAFVAYVKVHPLMVTLATMALYRGVAEGISLGQPVNDFPTSLQNFGRGALHGVPYAGVIFAIAAIAALVLLARTSFGLSLFAIGYNETASRYSGIPVDRYKLLLYTLAGAVSSLAAILFVGRYNTAKADVGQGIELDVITAVVLGGTSIFGGRGGILGTLLGLILIHETREFVTWHWSKAELNFIVLGALLILAVFFDSLLARSNSRK